MLMTSIKRSSASFDCITHVYDVTNYYQLLAYKHSLEGGKGCACLALKLIGVQTTGSRFDKWLWTLFKISRLFSAYHRTFYSFFILSLLLFFNFPFLFFFDKNQTSYLSYLIVSDDVRRVKIWTLYWCIDILIDRDGNIFIVFN